MPDTANETKTLTGSPANHNSAPTMIAMVIVVDRFGSRMMSRHTSMATGTSGTSSSRREALSRRREASRCAPQMHNATFTSSDGCTDRP